MKKVKYILAAEVSYSTLTIGKVYDVISQEHDLVVEYHSIYLLNDLGLKDWYFVNAFDGRPEFIDVTHEYRNEVIKCILE